MNTCFGRRASSSRSLNSVAVSSRSSPSRRTLNAAGSISSPSTAITLSVGAAAEPTDTAISVDDLEIDPGAFRVRRRGEDVPVTATEFRLLLELARRPKQVFTRELLLELVWNYDYLGDSRLVDAAVQRLRGKIEADPKEPKLIRTVRGVGYRLDPG